MADPTRDQLMQALKSAADAGDNAAANEIADHLDHMDSGGQPSAATVPQEPQLDHTPDKYGTDPNDNSFGTRLKRGTGRFVDAFKAKPVEATANLAEGSARGLLKPFGIGDTVGGLGGVAVQEVSGQGSGNVIQDFRDRRADTTTRRKQIEATTTGGVGSDIGETAGLAYGGAKIAEVPGLAIKAGEKALPIAAKLAGQGGIAGLGHGIGEGDDPQKLLTDTLTGAAAAPIIGKLVGIAGKVAGGVGTMFSNKGLSVLHEAMGRAGIDPKALQDAFTSFVDKTGRQPKNLLEILPNEVVDQLQSTIASRPGAADVVKAAATPYVNAIPADASRLAARMGPTAAVDDVTAPIVARGAQEAQGATQAGEVEATAAKAAGAQEANLNTQAADQLKIDNQRDIRSIAEGGNPDSVQAASSVERTRNARADAAMAQIEDRPVTLNARVRSVIANTRAPQGYLRELANNAPTEAERNRLQNVLDSLTGEGANNRPMTLTVRDFDSLRQALSSAAQKGDVKYNLGRLADILTTSVRRQVPGYDRFLRDYGERSAVAEGVRAGANVRTAPSTDFRQDFRAASGPTREGIEMGARKAIADQSSDVPGALSVAKDLADPGGELRGRMAATNGREIADQLTTTARGNLAGIEGHTQAAARATQDAADEAAGITAQRAREASQATADAADLAGSAKAARGVLNAPATEFASATGKAREALPHDTASIARAAISDAVKATPEQATKVIADLATDAGVQSNLQTVLGTTDAKAAQEAAEKLMQASYNVTRLARTKADTKDGGKKVLNESAKVFAILANRASGGLTADVLSNMLTNVRVPPMAAKKLATTLVSGKDGDVQKALDILRRTGKLDAALGRVYSGVGLAWGLDPEYTTRQGDNAISESAAAGAAALKAIPR